MGIFSHGPKLLVGLDVGSYSVKLCKLKMTDKGPQLVKYDWVNLPPETIVDTDVMNMPALIGAIRKLAKANDCFGAKCAVSVSGHSVIIKQISIPEMTPEELRESLQLEAEQYIPFDIKDCYVDAQILNQNQKAGPGIMDVVLVAAKKDTVNDVVVCVREAGLRPVVVEPDIFACQNAFMLNYGFPSNEVVVLANVGASVINLGIIANGISVFQRNISMGGGFVTEQVMKGLAVSWEEAVHYQTTDEDDEVSAVYREVRKIEKEAVTKLVTEIMRSIDFYLAITITADITRIYLSGGVANCTALARECEKRFELPIEVVNAFRNVAIDSRQFDLDLLSRFGSSSAVAVGLARRHIGDDTAGPSDIRINLIRGFKKQKRDSPLVPQTWNLRIPFTSIRCEVQLYSIR